MPQELISQFNRNFALPIETFRQVQTVTNRDAIPTNRRWEGMIVYVVTDSLSYVLVGGTANSQWVELGTLVDVTVVDNLLSTSPTDALSANQGRVLNITKQSLSEKGLANGYVPLNGSALIDSIYLPSYVDDILEFANLASFPDPGEIGKVYIALDTNLLYRWSGSVYVQVGGSSSVAWGSITGTLSAQTDLQTALNGKEPVFSKNTGFNKNFGTIAGTVSEGNHTHTFASITSKPTTIAGYGITDFNSLGDARWLGLTAKAADSNLLDGLDSTQFLRKDISDTTVGKLTVNTSQAANFAMDIINNDTGSSSNGLIVRVNNNSANNTVQRWWVNGAEIARMGADSNFTVTGSITGSNLSGTNTGDETANGILTKLLTVDGAGSGLDADLLDGVSGAGYMRANVATTNINGTNSTSKDTGAIVLTSGGLGVEQAIFSGGNMNAPNFVLTSDRRKKKNIQPIQLERLPINWKQFELKDFPGELRYGAIAQEVQKVAPELVTENGNGELSLKYIDLLVRKIAELENYIYGS